MLIDVALPENSAFAHGRNRVTHALLAGFQLTQLLDYGCGRGEFALAAASELGLQVHACDIDADLVDRLRQRHGAAVDFFAISDTEPTLPSKTDRCRL